MSISGAEHESAFADAGTYVLQSDFVKEASCFEASPEIHRAGKP